MWKIVVVLLPLAILAARLAYDAPVIQTRVGMLSAATGSEAPAPLIPPLMYAGVRG